MGGRERNQVAQDNSLSTNLPKSSHLLRAMCARVRDQIFNKLLGEIHVALQITKRHFRLDHPKLACMPGRVGVLSAKSGSKGVNVGQCAARMPPLPADRSQSNKSAGRKSLSRNRFRPLLFAARSRRSSVVTRNNSPAPSQSLPVMIGV